MGAAALAAIAAGLAAYYAWRSSSSTAGESAPAAGDLFSAVEGGIAAIDQRINDGLGAGTAVLDNFGVTTSKVYTLPTRATPYADQIAQSSAQYGLPDNLLAALLNQESGFKPDVIDGRRSSSAGAQGIAQFMPATSADLGIDPLNPAEAIPGAAKYLRSLYDQVGTWAAALAAYNWGVGNVKRKGIAAAPAETRNYVASISQAAGLDV